MSGATAAVGVGVAALGVGASLYNAQESKKGMRAANDLTGRQVDIAESQEARSADSWEFYKKNFRPILESEAKKAESYGSVEEQEEAAGIAAADVARAKEDALQSSERRLSQMGIRPSDNPDRWSSTIFNTNFLGDMQSAAAQTAARRGVRDAGFQKRLTVAGMGQAEMGNSATLSAMSGGNYGAAATRTGQQAQFQYGVDRQQIEDIAYGLKPIADYAGKGISSWTGGNRSGYIDVVPTTDASGRRINAADGVSEVQGPGTETSDSIPANLSKGESVLNAPATKIVKKMLGENFIDTVNRMGVESRAKNSKENVGLSAKLVDMVHA